MTNEEKWRVYGLVPCWGCGLPVSTSERNYCPSCAINGYPVRRNLDETVDKPN